MSRTPPSSRPATFPDPGRPISHDDEVRRVTAALSPPFGVPGRHFAAASAFLVLSGLALVWGAPALAAGAFSDPRLTAAAHLLTLGWITTSIMGALDPFLPVALGTSFRWPRITRITFWIWTAAVAAFVAGLAAAAPVLIVAGAGALGVAILLFVANLAATLPRSERRGLAWWCVAGAALFLSGAWVLGTLLAVNLRTGMLAGSRFPILVVHLHLAAGGWVLLMMIGLADRLLPLFLISHGSGRRPGRSSGRIAAVLVGAAAAMLLLSEHLLPAAIVRAALPLMAAGTVVFLFGAFRQYRQRGCTHLEPGMRLVAAGLLSLGLAVAAGVAALALEAPSSRLLTAYGVLLVPGGLGLLVAGFAYQIVPFLAWLQRFGPAAAGADVPRPADLFDPRAAHAGAALLAGGVLSMAAGSLVGSPVLCGAGAVGFTAGSAVTAAAARAAARSR